MTQSAHPQSDGQSAPRPEKARRIQRGEPFSSDDLGMDTSRYVQPYAVQSSTEANLPATPAVRDERTSQEGKHLAGGEATYE